MDVFDHDSLNPSKLFIHTSALGMSFHTGSQQYSVESPLGFIGPRLSERIAIPFFMVILNRTANFLYSSVL